MNDYCHRLFENIVGGHIDTISFFMSNEAWFHLSGHVNSQNTWYWMARNPNELLERSLETRKFIFGVPCAVSVLYDPYFLTNCQYTGLPRNFRRILCAIN